MFFDSLLQKLQASYQFKLEDYMDGMAVRSKPLQKMVSLMVEEVFIYQITYSSGGKPMACVPERALRAISAGMQP